MSYYQRHKQERLAYQQQYNKSEYYKAYQREYFQKNKERLRPKKIRKSLPQYKLNLLEQMLRRKLKEYKKKYILEDVMIYEEPPPVISEDTTQQFPPLYGFIITEDKFILTF